MTVSSEGARCKSLVVRGKVETRAHAVNAGILGTTDFATNSVPAAALIDLMDLTQPINYGGSLLLGLVNEVIPWPPGNPTGSLRTLLVVTHRPEEEPSPFTP